MRSVGGLSTGARSVGRGAFSDLRRIAGNVSGVGSFAVGFLSPSTGFALGELNTPTAPQMLWWTTDGGQRRAVLAVLAAGDLTTALGGWCESSGS